MEGRRRDPQRALATPYSFLTRPRGGSKTTDLAAIALTVMIAQAPPGARLYALAADRGQGTLLLDAVDGFVKRTPFLNGAVEISAYRPREAEVAYRRAGCLCCEASS